MPSRAAEDHARLRRLLRIPERSEAAAAPEVLIVDLAAGRLAGGHNEDYLAALTDALAGSAPEVWAPDRDGWGRGPGWARRAQDVALAWLAMRPRRGTTRVVITQAPSLWEIVTLRAVTLGARRRRAAAAFVLRRTGVGGGSRALRWLAGLSERSVRSLVRARRLWPVSDSRLALELVEADTGVRGTQVPIPRRRGAPGPSPRGGPPVVALLGAFRAEKGAAHYDAVVRAALAYDAAVEVDAQVGEGQGPDGSDALARELHSAWDGHERVRLHGGFLEPDEYDGVIARTDVVVLPYDVGAYGTGTSGILHEVLTAGGVVLTTPIEWATSEYGDHPRVRFLTATDPPTIEREVGAALELAARTRGDAAASGPPPDDEFVARWREAVDAAARWTSPR